jgi:hypothetical protein
MCCMPWPAGATILCLWRSLHKKPSLCAFTTARSTPSARACAVLWRPRARTCGTRIRQCNSHQHAHTNAYIHENDNVCTVGSLQRACALFVTRCTAYSMLVRTCAYIYMFAYICKCRQVLGYREGLRLFGAPRFLPYMCMCITSYIRVYKIHACVQPYA